MAIIQLTVKINLQIFNILKKGLLQDLCTVIIIIITKLYN